LRFAKSLIHRIMNYERLREKNNTKLVPAVTILSYMSNVDSHQHLENYYRADNSYINKNNLGCS
jgi:hypothetical protein